MSLRSFEVTFPLLSLLPISYLQPTDRLLRHCSPSGGPNSRGIRCYQGHGDHSHELWPDLRQELPRTAGAQSANVYLVMLAASQAAFAFYRIGNRSKRLPDIIAGFGITLVLLLAIRWGMTLQPRFASNAPRGNCRVASQQRAHQEPIALPISVFAVTAKLSAAPLALLIGFAALTMLLHERRRILTSIGIFLNYICVVLFIEHRSSGCLAFPAGLTYNFGHRPPTAWLITPISS